MVITWFGRCLMVFGLVFVLRRILLYRSVIEKDVLSLRLWILILVCSLLYGVISFMLPMGWVMLLRAQGVDASRLSIERSCVIYGINQIAKYIPGNIFHFAGRHLTASQWGVDHKSLAIAAVGEIIMLLIAAFLLSVCAFQSIYDILQIQNIVFYPFLAMLVIVGIILFIYTVKRWHYKYFSFCEVKCLILSQVNYVIFLLAACSLFYCVMQINGDSFKLQWTNYPFIVGAYAFAWAVGFVVPGAPGGVGVKEMVLLSMLTILIKENLVLFSIIMFRFVTIIGDGVFFSISMFIKKHLTEKHKILN